MLDPLRRQTKLLAWYDASARDLPWRRTRDPYAVLVSELMLQQTQAARVANRFPRFLERFPDVVVLADAQVGDVIAEWQGLGYNRRAVALHRTAVVVRDLHGGAIPRNLPALLALPGIGPYTARAVRAFAFAERAAPVDVNVARVLSRAFAGTALTRGQAQQWADAEVTASRPAGKRPDAWGQALMDLGSRHCRARHPQCSGCPIADACAWYGVRPHAEDPAATSPLRSRPQGRFPGSDRQFRGRMLDLLRTAPVPAGQIAGRVGLAEEVERAERLARALEAEGLARREGNFLRRP